MLHNKSKSQHSACWGELIRIFTYLLTSTKGPLDGPYMGCVTTRGHVDGHTGTTSVAFNQLHGYTRQNPAENLNLAAAGNVPPSTQVPASQKKTAWRQNRKALQGHTQMARKENGAFLTDGENQSIHLKSFLTASSPILFSHTISLHLATNHSQMGCASVNMTDSVLKQATPYIKFQIP